MTDFRALCAELHAAFNTYAVDMKHHDLLERARAALTEPKPPSLKEQALAALGPEPRPETGPTGDTILNHGAIERHRLVRRAIEALPNE
jgi:hypothetical protein